MISKLRNWLRQPTIEAQAIKVVPVHSSALTLEQWRADERLVHDAESLMRGQTFKLMRDVLENSHPRYLCFPLQGVQMEDRAAMQARSEGYQLCLNNLEALGEASQRPKPLVARFLPEDKPTNRKP